MGLRGKGLGGGGTGRGGGAKRGEGNCDAVGEGRRRRGTLWLFSAAHCAGALHGQSLSCLFFFFPFFPLFFPIFFSHFFPFVSPIFPFFSHFSPIYFPGGGCWWHQPSAVVPCSTIDVAAVVKL